MHSRIFTENAIAGIRRIFHPSDDGDSFTIETQQDVTAIVEANKAIMAHKGHGNSRKFAGNKFAYHVASIPLSIFFDLKRQGILGEGYTVLDEKRFSKWLNDRDNAAFRTHEGKV